jgi:hypothetical protein
MPNTDRIAQLLGDIHLLSPSLAELVQAVRTLALGLNPDVTEEVKYGGILFSAPQPFCGIFAYRQHVTLEFSNGAALTDQFKVLDGKGKFRRHIKLLTLDDVTGKHVLAYLRLAHQAQ